MIRHQILVANGGESLNLRNSDDSTRKKVTLKTPNNEGVEGDGGRVRPS